MINNLYPWQINLWQKFVSLKKQHRLPHAILVTGVRGLGKKYFADNLIKSILCLSPRESEESCEECHSCQIFVAGNHPDHIEVCQEKCGMQIKIKQIHPLMRKQKLTSTVSLWKTIVISTAHSMNMNTNNSLLKLLEEPQKNTLIILVTSQPNKIPITIRSRCQNLHMPIPDFNESMDWIVQHSNHQINETTKGILQLAKGAPLAAIDILNENGAEYYRQVDQDFDNILSGDANPITLTAKWLHFDLIQIINQLQYNIINRVVIAQTGVSHDPALNTKITIYWKIVDFTIHTKKLLLSQNNLNKTMLIEGFIVNITNLIHKNELTVM
ncbi:MAG: DNA replication protein [Piscirickettsiaceae bacterium]|nr:DNA replication protein [Piscirickettsiaceae bacterium]